MLRIFKGFKKKEVQKKKVHRAVSMKKATHVAERKGEIGEYKIDIQLAQLPKNYTYLSDVMIKNAKSVSGYSQIDHIVITPYGLFVIETKNYQGTIYGGEKRKTWLVNGKFKMMSPLMQNYGHVQAIKALLDASFTREIVSLITFTKRCTLKIDDKLRDISANPMVIYDIYLSETIHRKVSLARLQRQAPLYTDDEVNQMYEVIKKANIVDAGKRAEHTRKIQESQQQEKSPETAGSATCVICHKKVSEKVRKYCVENEKRFKGKVYCFDHQRKA